MPKNKIASRCISIIEMVGGVCGLCTIIYFVLSGIPGQITSDIPLISKVLLFVVTIYATAGYLLSLVAGIYLFNEHKKGFILSMIVQAIQIPTFSIAGFTYIFVSALEAIFYFQNGTFDYSFSCDASWHISHVFTETPFIFGINIVPLVFLIYLVIAYKRKRF